MKITLNIEVTNAEELGVISKALQGIQTCEVEADSVSQVEGSVPPVIEPAKKSPAKKATSKKVEKVEAEVMEEVPSPFVNVPTQPLFEEKAAPATTQFNIPASQPSIDSVALIDAASQKLLSFGGWEHAKKLEFLQAFRQHMNAPQNVSAKDFAEPFRTQFATMLMAEVDKVVATPQGLSI